MRARLSLVLAASVTLAACQADETNPSSAAPGAGAGQENFLTYVPQASLDGAQSGRLATIRRREATDQVHLARVAPGAERLLSRGAVLRLGIAPGLQVVAAGEQVNKRSAGDVSWGGPLQGGKDGWVQMVVAEGGVTATVTVGSDLYKVEPLGNGLHAVSKIDYDALPPEHSFDNPSGTLNEAIHAGVADVMAARAPLGEVSAAALTNINVMVVYTAKAASAAGNISSLIQLAVDETNQSYVNSGISISLNRVYTGQVSYNETGTFSQHVSRLRSTTDGYMDNVHTLRNTYAADVVVLVVNDSEACGIAAAINATASYGFAVAHYTCITGYYSFGHEIGHLQGARHDRYVDGTLSPYQYGHGFIPAAKNWRTIMAYGNNCGNCTRIQYWSNPLVTYGGVAMGTATYEDNARVLNLTAPTVAGFR